MTAAYIGLLACFNLIEFVYSSVSKGSVNYANSGTRTFDESSSSLEEVTSSVLSISKTLVVKEQAAQLTVGQMIS